MNYYRYKKLLLNSLIGIKFYLKGLNRRQQLVGVLIVLLVLGGIYARIAFRPHTAEIKPAPAPKISIPARQQVTYSRISFFFTKQVKGSLAIPDYWEGKYRKQDLGSDQVSISYINRAGEEKPLINLYYFAQEAWQKSQTGKAIYNNNGQVISYVLAAENPFPAGEDKDKFQKMLEESVDIMKSFKAFN